MTFEEYRACDATELAARVRRGETSAAELVHLATTRLDAVEPQLNAIVYDSRALAADMAAAIDAELGAGAAAANAVPDRPFAGVPFLIKDQKIPVAGLPMRAGSRGHRDRISEVDGFLTGKLRAAGFCFLGKSNLPELGFTPFTEPVASGPTHNPWDLSRTPGGSSGGSAAAVAAGVVPIATAADGGGSIRIPASCCGLVGLKPSRGRISLAPAGSDAWNYAVSEGCVSRSVRDTAAYLDAASGPAPGDAFVVAPPAEPFARAYARTPPRLRIALSAVSPLRDVRLDPDCVAAVHHTAALLRGLGHAVEEVAIPYRDRDLREAFSTVIFGEAAATVAEVRTALGRRPTGDDLEFATRLSGAMGEVFTAGEYARAKARWSALTREVGIFQETYDLILTPTLGLRPFRIGALQPSAAEVRAGELMLRLGLARVAKPFVARQAGRFYGWIPFTPFANMTGQPSISLPLFWNADGLPVGTMLTGRIHDDALVLQVARELEGAQPWLANVPEHI